MPRHLRFICRIGHGGLRAVVALDLLCSRLRSGDFENSILLGCRPCEGKSVVSSHMWIKGVRKDEPAGHGFEARPTRQPYACFGELAAGIAVTSA